MGDKQEEISPGTAWIGRLAQHLATPLSPADMAFLRRFEHDLLHAVADVGGKQRLAGAALKRAKQKLAAQYGSVDVPRALGGKGMSFAVQAGIQFICGYMDLDLRDTAGVGHGRTIVRTADSQEKPWLRRVVDGGLAALTATEAGGGTAIHRIGTTATERTPDCWVLNGEKVHVSRLEEADVYVVLCRTSQGLATVAIDPTSAGINLDVAEPIGLRGWSWGRVVFQDVEFASDAFVGAPGEGHTVFSDHFAYYRPIVAATALGSAARVWDEVVTSYAPRLGVNRLERPRDFVLRQLGQRRFEIEAGLLAVMCTNLPTYGHVTAHELAWGMATKASLCGLALEATSELATILGAAGIKQGHAVEKTLRDLTAYQYADGLRSELLRAAGKQQLYTPDSARDWRSH